VTEQEKSPLEQALDLLLYAPVGLAMTAREELPKLIEKGRQRVSGQVGLAKMMGEYAVREGQKEAGKAVKQAASTLQDLGVIPGRPADPAPNPVITTEAIEKPVSVPTPSNGKASNGSRSPKLSADGLAIPGYDALSASQVVQRLAGLAPAELEAVRDYEAATRGRRTILSRVAQLQAGPA
jgi:hypothetical protein